MKFKFRYKFYTYFRNPMPRYIKSRQHNNIEHQQQRGQYS